MDLIFFLKALLRKKWVIIICTLAGFSAALLFTFTKKKLYLSAAQYSTGFTMKQQVKISTDEGLNFFEIDQRFKNVIETFKSPVVVCMVSYDLMLHDLTSGRPYTILSEKDRSKPEYKNVDLEKAKRILEQKKASKEILKAYDPEEKKVFELIQLYQYDNESLLNQLSVDRVQGTDYLNILYKSEHPEMSAFVVNTIGKEFISFFSSINNTRTEESAGRLDSLAEKKKLEIEEKNNKLITFKEKFKSPDIADRSKAAFDILKDQQTQLSTETGKLNIMQADLNSVNQQLQGLNSAATSTDNSANNSEYITLQQKNRQLASDLANKGGIDQAIEDQIKANQKRMQLIQPSYVNNTDKSEIKKKREELVNQKISLQNQLEGQKTTIATLQSSVNKFNSMANTGAGQDVIVNQMQAEIDLATKQYEQMIGRLQNAQDVNVAPDINFKQTLVGQPAIQSEPSHRKVIIGIGAIAALMLSSLIILIIDFMDSSLRAPSIFNRVVHLNLLSVVNKIDLKNKLLGDYFNLNEEDRKSSENIYVENLRKLRYEIETSGKKIILFTSTKPQEGKTTIIESLAYSFSLSKKKVLIIDTNFSNNSLTEKFEAKQVLEQFSLNGDRSITDKLVGITSMTKIPNVDIIGCKEGNYSPAEILPKNNLLEFLPQIIQQYDYILMEGAALNFHADSKELSKYADLIIPVFSSRSIIGHVDKESIKFMKDHNEKLIGAVLNEIDLENIDM